MARDLRLGARHAPVVNGPQRVNAPWLASHVVGQRVPFILDLQAAEFREARLRSLLAEGQKKNRKRD
jgi:hypothetical protein